MVCVWPPAQGTRKACHGAGWRNRKTKRRAGTGSDARRDRGGRGAAAAAKAIAASGTPTAAAKRSLRSFGPRVAQHQSGSLPGSLEKHNQLITTDSDIISRAWAERPGYIPTIPIRPIYRGPYVVVMTMMVIIQF